MKSQITRIKNRARSVSARTLALALCFVMLLTAIGAGTMMTAFAVYDPSLAGVAVDSEAADADAASADAAQQVDASADSSADVNDTEDADAEPVFTRKADDPAVTGAAVDLAETGYSSFQILYSFNSGSTSTYSSSVSIGSMVTVDCSSMTSGSILYFKVKAENDTMSYSGGGVMSSGDNYNISTYNSGNWGKATVTKKNAKFTVTDNASKVTFTNDGDALSGGSGSGSGSSGSGSINKASNTTMLVTAFTDSGDTYHNNTYTYMKINNQGYMSAPTSMTDANYGGVRYYKPTNKNDTTHNIAVELYTGSNWSDNQWNWGEKEGFKEGTQYVIWRTSKNNGGTGESFTPLTITDLTYPDAIVKGSASTIKLSATGGFPWFYYEKLGNKSEGKQYRLKITNKAGTVLMNNSTFKYSDGYKEYSWTPSSVDDNQLTFTLSDNDGIDSVSYTNTFTVFEKLPKSSVIVDKNSKATVTATWNGVSISNGRKLNNVPAGAKVTISGDAKTGNKFTGVTVKAADGSNVTLSGTTTGTSISGVTFTMPASNVTVTAATEEYWGEKTGTVLKRMNSNAPSNLETIIDASTTYVYKSDDSLTHLYAKIPIDKVYESGRTYLALVDGDTICWTGDDNYVNVAVTEDSKNYLNVYHEVFDYWQAEYSSIQLTNNDYRNLIDYIILDVTRSSDQTTGTYNYSVHFKEDASSTEVVSFIAKDGTLTNSGSTEAKHSTFARYSTVSVKSGDTTVGTQTSFTTSYGTGAGKYYSGVLTKGTTYTLQAVVTDKRYYVKAFNVNGVSVAVLDKPASQPGSSATYTCSYTVPNDAPAVLEIQPVYYHYDDSNCVTFYLEGYDDVIQEDLEWGHTPYVYPFYATQTGDSSGGASSGHNAFGAYPGQPMVFANGVYEIQIPTTNIDLAQNTETGTNIKGITINNGWNDLIHRGIMGWGTDDIAHKQTYDYDDFHKIFVEKTPTNIYYQMILKENRDNSATYRHTPATSLTSTKIDDIGSNGNGWELLKDKFNRTTDILGNALSGDALNADPLYVISTGYIANVAGDYGTEWRVYRKNGSSYSLVTGGSKNSIPPSLLFMNNAASFSNSSYPTNTHPFKVGGENVASPNSKPSDYKTLYETLSKDYTNSPVYVSYEKNDRSTKSNYNVGDKSDTMYGAWRLDGRWFYTSAGDIISSEIQIEYIDGAGGYQTEESYVEGFSGKTNRGSHTGAIAYFTDGAFYAERESGDVVLDKTKNFSMTAQAADGYEFVGWYNKHGSSYASMNPTNKTSVTATIPRSSGGTYVARYKKLTKGNLVVSNTNATGTVTGTTYNGTGKGLLTVSYSTNGGTDWTQIGTASSADDITIGTDILSDDNLGKGTNFKLKVVLGNTPDGEDSFGVYLNKYTNRTMTAASNEYILDLIDLFTVTQADGDNVYEQNVFSLPFETYFNQHEYQYTITYTYTSLRLDKTQTFTKTGTFTSAQVSEYVEGAGNARRLTDAFITEIKPKESNFRKNMTFTVGTKGMSTSGDTTTFTGAAAYTNIDDASVRVSLDLPYAVTDRIADGGYDLSAADGVTYDDTLPVFTVTLSEGYGKFLTRTATAEESSSDLLTAPASVTEDGETKNFSFWRVTDNVGNEVVKVFSPRFNYRLYDNYTLTPVFAATINNELVDRIWADGDGNKSASITYLGTTRNQWNNNGNGGYTINNANADKASDILFNDFIVAFNYKDQELKNVSGAACGIVLEKISEVETDSQGKAITDMATYAAKAADHSGSIKDYITGGGNGGLTLKTYTLNVAKLDNKNRCEFFYNTYNRVGDETANRKASSNVYRAYSYLKVGSDVILSEPVYFTMYGEAN